MNSYRQKKDAPKPLLSKLSFQKPRKKGPAKRTVQIDVRANKEFLREEMIEMKKLYPGSSKFLGRLEYTVGPKKLGFIKRTYPDLKVLRDHVVRFANKEILEDPRPEIKKMLKRYPAYPDLRALNAIQIFSDACQSGLDSKKIKIVKGALREISRAIYNGGFNLFNVNWFLKIYIRYIDSLRERYLQIYNNTKNHADREIRNLARSIHRNHIQLTAMCGIKTKLSSLELLNTKLKDTVYSFSPISIEDMKKASQAMINGDTNKKIGGGEKTAGNVFNIVMTLSILFARIPILRKLVDDYQNQIPENTRDIILQKVMIRSMQRLVDFQLSLAAGNKERAKSIAQKAYNEQQDVIQAYLAQGILTRQYEIDPFIKTAWFAKESRGLFPDEAYRTMLEHANKMADVLFGTRVQVQGAAKMAGTIQDEIQYIMITEGWMN